MKVEPRRDEEASRTLDSSEDLSNFTIEEVNKLQKELKKLLSLKSKTKSTGSEVGEEDRAKLPLNRFLNCPSSLEVDRIASAKLEHLDNDNNGDLSPNTKIILSKVKEVLLGNRNAIKKKSTSFLLKRMFVCGVGGFAPAPGFRDPMPESRMEKVIVLMEYGRQVGQFVPLTILALRRHLPLSILPSHLPIDLSPQSDGHVARLRRSSRQSLNVKLLTSTADGCMHARTHVYTVRCGSPDHPKSTKLWCRCLASSGSHAAPPPLWSIRMGFSTEKKFDVIPLTNPARPTPRKKAPDMGVATWTPDARLESDKLQRIRESSQLALKLDMAELGGGKKWRTSLYGPDSL
ncbi:hypothetical protein GW17_00011612 [Ensete ventricosum]|nr:hypothetical protein GW17_00011612 [Ensete ventricosum]